VEGEDYYLERGNWVFTAKYLLNRGYCCRSGCRHCPYGFVKEEGKKSSPQISADER
jgi:urocanate hydratase